MVDRNKEYTKAVETDSLFMRMLNNAYYDVWDDNDWFSDDKGGQWHVDCPTNPYGDKGYDPDAEPYNPIAWIDDYCDKYLQDEHAGKDISYALLNEYLYTTFPNDSAHIKTLTLVIFSRLMKIDFSDVLDLVAMHPTKHSTTGLSKLRNELQGVKKKVFADVVMDYIAMMKEAGMPSINEEHLIATKDRYSTLAEFWHIYGAMAFLVHEEDDAQRFPGEENLNANYIAIERFKAKVSDDLNVLYPLLTYLYSQWAEDENWLKATKEIQDNIPYRDLDAPFMERLGYPGLMYARDKLEPFTKRNKEPGAYQNREADWNEFIESKAEDLNTFIKNKYFT